MNLHAIHLMDTELIEDRATVRYSCPVCERCVEDGPEGLVVLHRGDAAASHRGGRLSEVHQEVEAGAPATLSPGRVLH
jgi:hypothetical protein